MAWFRKPKRTYRAPTSPKEIIQRVEAREEADWRAAYAHLLPPVPAPIRSPDCTCDWIEERMLCTSEPRYWHSRYGEDCPDHQEPEKVPSQNNDGSAIDARR